jgi:ATP-binding cassette subfamily C protein
VTAPLTSGNPLREALGRGTGILVVAFVLSFVFNLLSLAGPIFMLLIFDRVLPARSEETLVTLFLLVVALLAVLALVDYARRRLLARFGARFQELVENRLFDGTTRSGWFQRASRKPTAGLDDLDALRGFFHSGAMIAVLDVFWAPMFLLAIFILHPGLGWVALAGIAVLVVLAVLRWTMSGGREERLQEAQRRIGALKEMALQGRGTLRTQEMTAGYGDRWLEARRQSRDRSIELRDLTTWHSVAARQVQGLARYAVMAFGAWLTLRGELTIGAMVAATFLSQRAINPVDAFLDEAPAIFGTFGHWADLRSVLSGRAGPLRDATPLAQPAGVPVVALQRVTVRSPATGATALNTLSFTFPAGSITEITGASGAGKSLLAEVLLGLTPAASGHVLFRGAPVQQLSPAAARQAFGYVAETADFVTGTIAENIARLDPAVGHDAVVAAARQARVHEFIVSLPEGYATRLDAAERPFSRGQRTQIALARALCGSPDLLVIDDPDPVLRRLLQKDLRATLDALKARGAAVVILARDTLGLRNLTQAATLDAGRLKALEAPATPVVAAQDDKKVSPLIRK